MFEEYKERVQYRLRQGQKINIALALATGVLTLFFPNFLYIIAGGYLIALGVLFMMFRIPSSISAVPVIMGVVIFVFPEFIPITFAIFLGLFGLMMLAFQFTFIGATSLLIAILIITNPDFVAYLIAAFLLMYAISNLIRLYQAWQNPDQDPDDGPVSIQ